PGDSKSARNEPEDVGGAHVLMCWRLPWRIPSAPTILGTSHVLDAAMSCTSGGHAMVIRIETRAQIRPQRYAPQMVSTRSDRRSRTDRWRKDVMAVTPLHHSS